MNINQKGVDLVKHFEGVRLTAYVDPVGILTIGYGHTGNDVTHGLTISEEKADQFLRADLEKAAAGVRRAVTVDLNSNQFSALTSFAFNVGIGGLRSSTLLRRLNAGDVRGASKEFSKWVKGTINGRKISLPGLVRRRKAEQALFDTAEADAPTIVPAEPADTKKDETFFYIVSPGDTFSAIAARNGLSLETLLTWNPHIADPNLLFPGDLIQFRDAPPEKEQPLPAAPDLASPLDADISHGPAPWFAIAGNETGIAEVSGKLRNNARILEYHRSTSLNKKLAARDETPWCSSFVNWCIEGSSLKGTDSAMARSWLKWGEKLDKAREGCIVVFARPAAGPKAGHVAFFVKETAERIHVLGGNQSNQVKLSRYAKKDLLGYRWPKGKPGRTPPTEPAPTPEPSEEQVFYLVQPGDTLQAIAERNQVTLDDVRAWNPHIANPSLIRPGDMILLVGTDAPAPPDEPILEESKTPWFDIAQREKGVAEKKGTNANNPRILEYHRSTTLPGNLARIDETAWCSSFVNWCVTRSGLTGTNSARARSWHQWGKKLRKPRPGCVVVLSRPNAGPKAGHVGFYAGETATKIKLLGGNQSNSVRITTYPKNRLLSYRWPNEIPADGGVSGGERRFRPPLLSRLRLLGSRIRALRPARRRRTKRNK